MVKYKKLTLIITLAFAGVGQSAAVVYPYVVSPVPDVPLDLATSVPPNVVFALSVEFPTAVTAAYRGQADYARVSQYLGLFDPRKCYSYTGNWSSSSNDGWFSPVRMASSNHSCDGVTQWSGNFLNWATMTTLDEFRFAMTGGNRYKDIAGQTVVERTFMSPGQGSTGKNFPNKGFDRTGGAYAVGAVPSYLTSTGTLVSLGNGVQMRTTDSKKNAMYFNVRAEVCNPRVGLEGNCVQHGDNSYKPEGAVHKYSSKMRFGAFSYFNSSITDNAVMRSPLKFVGPQSWSESGSQKNNSTEWKSEDGTYITNPDPNIANAAFPAAVQRSGVINYINQFGKSSGSYKSYDDVGKLYYEALNYLSGRNPTAIFYNKATTSSQDGFPIVTKWDDPVKYWCQKNYVIVMGDSHTHCDWSLPGNGSSGPRYCPPADNRNLTGGPPGLNVVSWTNMLGSLEGRTRLATTGGGAGGAGSYYMSGLAYWANKNGVRKISNQDIKVKTIVIDVNEAGDGGYNSQYWYASKYGGAKSFDGSGKPQDWSTTGKPRSLFSYGQPPTDTTPWPKNLLRGGDPEAMIDAVNSALAAISSDQTGSQSALAQSSGDLTAPGSSAYIYKSSYKSKDWSGDLVALTINSRGTISTTPAWSAAAQMPAVADRQIYTFNNGLDVAGNDVSASNSRKGVVFSYGNLSPSQKNALDVTPGAALDSRGDQRLQYLRGDKSNEGSNGFKWRARSTLLGDIVDSSPAYVGGVSSQFALLHTDARDLIVAARVRPPMLYVGANDGMLHAFDARTGREQFAYVPSAVYGRLNQLMENDYGHKYYVDGSPVAESVQLDGSGWKTLLVGGLGAGGQGVYALDVTSPVAGAKWFTEKNVMWEFTDRDDPQLGYTYGKPVIGKMKDGKWKVILGSGYYNNVDDGGKGSGRAYLFVLDAEGPGVGGKWKENRNYYKIEVKSPAEPVAGYKDTSNGMSSPVLVKDAKDIINYVYIGDREGNLWKFDFVSDAKPTQASPAGQPLFTAKSSNNMLQQITTAPAVSRHPDGGYIALFGTGAYIEASDKNNLQTQTFYGIWDKTDNSVSSTITRAVLQPQKITKTVMSASNEYYIQSNCVPNYAGSSVTTIPTNCPYPVSASKQLGWYFDLPHQGERVLASQPELVAGVLSFNTMSTSGGDICSGSTTVGRGYDINYLTGGAIVGGIYDLNKNGRIDDGDYVNGDFPSGRLYPEGVSYGGAKFRINLGGTQIPGTTTPGSPSANNACSNGYIAGWGCMEDIARSSCAPIMHEDGSMTCPPKTQGRLTWRSSH